MTSPLIHNMNDLIETTNGQEAAGGCNCGHQPDASIPVLDLRAIPHSIRHATVFGALEAVPAGSSLILMAPHDPIPLLNQIEERHQGAFVASYREQGPETWQVEVQRSR